MRILGLSLLLAGWVAGASADVAAPTQTIVVKEVAGYFHGDGELKTASGIFEYVLEISDDAVVRRSVRNTTSGEVTVDDTRYRFLTALDSHNVDALQFRRLTDAERKSAPVIRVIGQPGSDAIEIMTIGPDWVQSVKTVRDYMVVQRFVRIR